MTAIAHSVPRSPVISAVREASTSAEWQGLYRVGALAAFAIVALVPPQIAVFTLWPPPTTLSGWFALFQQNALLGLLSMDLLMIADYVFFAVLFLALFVALRRASASVAALALMLEVIAVAIYVGSNHLFEMLAASSQYATAVTDAERATALGVGSVMLVTWQGSAFSVSYVLSGAAQLLMGIAMFRSGAFGRFGATAGIIAGTAALVPPTVGTVGLVLSLVSLVPMGIWLLLTGRSLVRLSAVSEGRI